MTDHGPKLTTAANLSSRTGPPHFLFPDLAPVKILGLDGLLPIAMLHYLAGVAVILFMLAHIYLGTTGVRVGSLFEMMITGWHEE